MILRSALAADLDQVLAIADRRRHQYAAYQPQFWNPSSDAVRRQRDYFTSLLADPAKLFVVAVANDRLRGFVIATLAPAPPVYDPGGLTCLVDDFTVDEPESWLEVGPQLLDSVRSWAEERGAVQLVVVTAGGDDPKRAVLNSVGLSLASEWWVGPA